MRERDKSLDTAKAIAIILVVVAHSGVPHWLTQFIYQFHMPLFFFISGVVLSDKYLSDIKTGIKKKLKAYYIPFVKWNLLFILLHNVFTTLHFCNDKYDLTLTGIHIVQTLTMTGQEPLLAPYWFLISITSASIMAILLLNAMAKAKVLNKRNLGGWVLIIVILSSVRHIFPYSKLDLLGKSYLFGFSLHAERLLI